MMMSEFDGESYKHLDIVVYLLQEAGAIPTTEDLFAAIYKEQRRSSHQVDDTEDIRS